jgi:hypothetical protein
MKNTRKITNRRRFQITKIAILNSALVKAYKPLPNLLNKLRGKKVNRN